MDQPINKTHTIIYEGSGGDRIDVYLTQNHEYTRNFFHRLVARGDIIVNNKIIKKKSLGLKTGDKITIVHPERYMESEALAQSPEIDLKILIEKPDYIVIYKPKGVLSHPNSVRGVEHANIVGALYHYYKKQNLPTTGNFIRAGLIHRLDKETDGLMLIVKTEAGLKYFKDLFQRKSLAETIEEKDQVPLKKFYRAQVLVTRQGRQFIDNISLPHIIQEMVIPKTPHPIPKMGITKIVSLRAEHGNPSGSMDHFVPHPKDTSYRVRDDENIINIEIEILTGRTHQIRYHLSKNGLPIIGDYLYMDKSTYNEDDSMHLQAYRLSFIDIDGEQIDVQCERSW